MSKDWTPGPHTFKPSASDKFHSRIVCSGAALAIFKNEPNPANAELWAAAPDLYEALEEIIEENWADVRLPVHLLEQAEAALAKARGETA